MRLHLNPWLLGLALAGAVGAAGPRRPPERPVNLNTATRSELMQLPRVGRAPPSGSSPSARSMALSSGRRS